jgi:hypothetical protein
LGEIKQGKEGKKMKERRDLNKKVADLAIESLNAGNQKDAEKYILQLEQEGYAIKDLLVDMVHGLLTYIGKTYGEEKVTEGWEYAAEQFWTPAIEQFKTMEPIEVISAFAAFHRGLGSEFKVEEGEDKATITISGCGSGAKLLKEGKCENSDRHPINGGIFSKEKSCKMCGKDMITYYCVHGPVMYTQLPEKYGYGDQMKYEYGRQYDDDGNQVDECCQLTISKKQ